MKKILPIIIIACLYSLSSNAKETKMPSSICKIDTLPTNQLITLLQQLNVNSFHNQPVDSFLITIPANFYNMKIYGGSHSQGALRRASYLTINFTPSLYGPGVKIYVSDYTHMNRYSPTSTWDINLFRKENIYKIEIWKDQNTCINGACMQ